MLVSGWFSVHCIILRGSSVDRFGYFATIIENLYCTTELGLNLAGSQCGRPYTNIAKTANIRERGHCSRTGPITGISAFLRTPFYRRLSSVCTCKAQYNRGIMLLNGWMHWYKVANILWVVARAMFHSCLSVKMLNPMRHLHWFYHLAGKKKIV